MQASHLGELIELEESYWWHVAKRQLVIDLLGRHAPPPGRLVEGGVGSARNLIEFRDRGYDVAGLDLMPEAVAHARQRGLDDVHEHDLTRPWPFEEGSADVVVLLDVLEHLSDPVGTLRHIHRVLKPGGKVVLTVPAHPWLYGGWDAALGHYRRYRTAELRAHAEAGGLAVLRISYWNSFTFPAAVCVRGIQKLLPPRRRAEFPRVAPLANRGLLTAARMERWWLQRLPGACGLSLFAVLERAV
jgi:SAM-dependent methyltransferase